MRRAYRDRENPRTSRRFTISTPKSRLRHQQSGGADPAEEQKEDSDRLKARSFNKIQKVAAQTVQMKIYQRAMEEGMNINIDDAKRDKILKQIARSIEHNLRTITQLNKMIALGTEVRGVYHDLKMSPAQMAETTGFYGADYKRRLVIDAQREITDFINDQQEDNYSFIDD